MNLTTTKFKNTHHLFFKYNFLPFGTKPNPSHLKLASYKNNPHLFAEKSKAQFPDLTNPQITFPIKVGLTKTYIRKHVKQPKLLIDYLRNETINYKIMSGNQIVLMLDQHCEQMKYSEISKGLYELSLRHQKANLDVDWDQHQTIHKVATVLINNLRYFKKKELAVLTVGLDQLQIKDHDLWASLQREVLKCLLTFEKKEFLSVFYAFMKRDNSEVKKQMVDLLPKYLKEISPDNFMKCYYVVRQNQMMSDYLYEDHFHAIFWNNIRWFGDKNTAQIIKIMIHGKYYSDDIGLWTDNVLKHLNGSYESKTNTAALIALRTSLNDLENFLPELARTIHEITAKIDAQIEFLSTVYMRAQQSKVHNVVQQELEYYKQLQIEALKEKLRTQKQEQGQQQQ